MMYSIMLLVSLYELSSESKRKQLNYKPIPMFHSFPAKIVTQVAGKKRSSMNIS